MLKNLEILFSQADEMDISDGKQAYKRYHRVLLGIAVYYGQPMSRVVAAFAALSPNNDYVGNLRSLVSMLDAKRRGYEYKDAIVSTYKAARARANLYLTGTPFLDHAKGLKTRAFYQNLLHPEMDGPVTVDGHMYHAWMGTTGGMKDANVTAKLYAEISDATRRLAAEHGYLAHEAQAILWYTRKRLLGIVYDPQLALFAQHGGYQQAHFAPQEIRPYGVENETQDFRIDPLGTCEGSASRSSQRSQLDLPFPG